MPQHVTSGGRPPAPAHARPPGRDRPGAGNLESMVAHHYDNQAQMRLKGEIHFDTELSRAEVSMAAHAYGRPLPDLVYLPCCGTLRHARPLLAAGAQRVIGVDLSSVGLRVGLERNVPAGLRQRVTVFHGDIRDAAGVLPARGVGLAILAGNSLGDVADPAGHEQVIAHLAAALAPGGVLVFDYVGDRYNPPADGQMAQWPEIYQGPGGDIDVIDLRTRRLSPLPGTGMALLRLTCEVRDAATGEPVLAAHAYDKLIVPDELLARQFAAAGLDLVNLGPVTALSPYHRRRVRDVGDLGMLGEPNCLYRAVKK